MIPAVCSSILGHVCTSFIFDRNEGDAISDETIKAIAKLMDTMAISTLTQLPNMQSRFNESLSKLMAVPQDASLFVPNFAHFLSEIYEQFFKKDDETEENSNVDVNANRVSISYDFIDGILSYIETNSEQLKEMFADSKTPQIPQAFYNILYWPLSMALNRIEVSLFSHRFELN